LRRDIDDAVCRNIIWQGCSVPDDQVNAEINANCPTFKHFIGRYQAEILLLLSALIPIFAGWNLLDALILLIGPRLPQKTLNSLERT